MNLLTEIKLHGETLEDGESVRVLCPQCVGGDSREVTFCLTREGDSLLYVCHRNKCQFSGAIGSRADFVRTRRDQPRTDSFTPFTGELEYLDDEQEYGLSILPPYFDADHLIVARLYYASESNRYAYPIFAPLGRRRGYVLRSYDGAEPKAMTRMECDEPHMSWYREQNTSSVCVVEDIPSAVRASRYVDSVALCGTGCGPDYAREIAAHYTNVVWALDADAFQQALGHHRRWRILFEHSMVLLLEQDFKDTQEDELCDLLSFVSSP